MIRFCKVDIITHNNGMPRMRLNRTKGLPISQFSFSHIFRTQVFGRPVRQYSRRTNDAIAREEASHVKSPGGLYNEFNTCFSYNPAACPWRGICQILPSLAYRTFCIVLLSQQPFFNEQYIALTYYCTYLFLYTNMFGHDILQPYTLVWIIHQGLTTPHNMV